VFWLSILNSNYISNTAGMNHLNTGFYFVQRATAKGQMQVEIKGIIRWVSEYTLLT
jgi:hypothetical protein